MPLKQSRDSGLEGGAAATLIVALSCTESASDEITFIDGKRTQL